LSGQDGVSHAADLPDGESGIFLILLILGLDTISENPK
jgi:hypothetical protein